MIRGNPGVKKMAEPILAPSFSGPIVDPDHPWLGLHPLSDSGRCVYFWISARKRRDLSNRSELRLPRPVRPPPGT
jgi:hypothetical protein